ncbi:MAG: transcription-repair coupling factor [Ruminococcaceae bacterium]|nr:transcription-repair coupling factor [Oscillospiraceae bacterium]
MFKKILVGSSEWQQAEAFVQGGSLPLAVTGLTEQAKAQLAAHFTEDVAAGALVVCDSDLTAQRFCEDMSFFLGRPCIYYPSKEIEYYRVDAKSNELEAQRLAALRVLAEGEEAPVLVLCIEALLQFAADFRAFRDSIITLEDGGSYDTEKLLSELEALGYVREETVEARGQFSVRGGIVDIYPPSAENPYRVEFFGNEIDSVRAFDPIMQTSVEKLSVISVEAAREIEAGAGVPPCVADYLPEEAMVFWNEPERIRERAEGLLWNIGETVTALLEKGVISEAKEAYIHDYDSVTEKLLSHPFIGLYTLPQSYQTYRPKAQVNLTSHDVTTYSGRRDLWYQDLSDWLSKPYAVVISAASTQRRDALFQELLDEGFPVLLASEDSEAKKGQILLLEGSLKKGVLYPEAGLVLLTDSEISGREARRRRHKKAAAGNKLKSFDDLDIGDYVVHSTHGIGQYVGLDTLEVEGHYKDYLKIQYAGTDYLYVPCDQLELLQKYIGKETRVRLSKMGGADFARQKAKVKRSTMEMAQGLIALYAARQAAKGYAYSPDTAWQKEFEDRFPYEETEDQLQAISEVKQDMESSRSMDRLLCGDVGYGKTEVALRAAFKAVQDSKQVAYLAPTTVLALQHFNTFTKRMKAFPVRVELLSRLISAKEQSAILRRLKSGETDIVIGTHRLLGTDVEFHDLGLLVVDEEQRFGVRHKERIKEMKNNVDVLTLSATPIPRTLHMSMVHIKDMSLLSEPPQDRHPVATYVLEFNQDIVIDAIQKELARGGQVYYLHNRTQSIAGCVRRLESALPGARIRFAHGQMEPEELEDVMLLMQQGEIDVLVCTTIVETGLDIPNVNTMIVEDADRLGLSQLYQLRGRVGRSNRRAYCYLTYRQDKSLREEAVKRLSAIREFTEFGSGFKIALRDLEIRGAGNLLGAEQHGHMETVGYDMYCRLLEESVNELQGRPPQAEDWEPQLDFEADAYIPASYIKSHRLRLEFYKKIAAAVSEEDCRDTMDELIDRFGEYPASVGNLLTSVRIKALAKETGLSQIVLREGRVLCYFKEGFDPALLAELINHYSGRILLSAGQKPYFSYRLEPEEKKSVTDSIKSLLQTYKDLHHKGK